MLYCYDANQIGGPAKCYGQTMTCHLAIDLFYANLIILLPLGLMFVLGLLIIWNICYRRIRIQNMHVTKSTSTRTPMTDLSSGQLLRKKENRQLLLRLLGHVIILFLLTSSHAIQKLYKTFLANGMPFYIYTLTGGYVFRNALFNLIKMI